MEEKGSFFVKNPGSLSVRRCGHCGQLLEKKTIGLAVGWGGEEVIKEVCPNGCASTPPAPAALLNENQKPW